MNLTEVITSLERVVPVNTDPVIDAREVQDTLDAAQLSETEWDVDAAAASLWAVKAGRVAHMVDHSDEGASFDASQKFKHCMAMAEHHRNLSATFLAARAATLAAGRLKPLRSTSVRVEYVY